MPVSNRKRVLDDTQHNGRHGGGDAGSKKRQRSDGTRATPGTQDKTPSSSSKRSTKGAAATLRGGAHGSAASGSASRPSATAPTSTSSLLPDAPLLYYTALSAHHSAAAHYQQTFVPLGASDPKDDVDRVAMYVDNAESSCIFTHDVYAGHTAFRLLLLSLDLLSIGLSQKGLSDRERVAFSLEFVTVALKLIHAVALLDVMRGPERAMYGVEINKKQILEDAEIVLTKSRAIAQRGAHLKVYANALELASFRFDLAKDKAVRGRQILKHTLKDVPSDDYHRRYSLQLEHLSLLREMRSFDFFRVASELEKEAEKANHTYVVQVVQIARLSAHFALRKWDDLGDSLARAAEVFGVNGDGKDWESDDPLSVMLMIHYLHFRALHAGRIGNKELSKTTHRTLYGLMDTSTSKGDVFPKFKATGGVMEIPLPSTSGPTQTLFIQTTPMNFLFTLASLNSLVSHRSYQGEGCRALHQSEFARENENEVCYDDMWDTGFTAMHGVGDALQLRRRMMMVRVEVMMEQALALICRSAFEEANTLLTDILAIMNACNLFRTHMPHISLLFAQFAQSMGRPEIAERYYLAAGYRVNPNSEMGTLVQIGLLSARGKLANLEDDPEGLQEVLTLADMCRSGSNADLHAIGNLISGINDPDRLSSKSKLAAAYKTICNGSLNMLYALIFAFTTTSNLFGDREGQLKQHETGLVHAKWLGPSKANTDIGQALLGWWYTSKLQEHYRLEGDFAKEEDAKAQAEAHMVRIKEVYAFSLERYSPDYIAERAKKRQKIKHNQQQTTQSPS